MSEDSTQKNVLDKGFVRLVTYMGSDELILKAARVSTGAVSKGEKRDRGLIRYLFRNKHTSPFEMTDFIFHVRAPIVVARQWMRHRTASINEASGRYKVMQSDYYVPNSWRKQSEKNHQGSAGVFEEEQNRELSYDVTGHVFESDALYQDMIQKGVAREMARFVQPVNIYTEWYWKIDLHNLLHFLRLRMDPHAQSEIREYAHAMYNIVKETEQFPYTMEIFDQVREVESIVQDMMNSDKELEELPDYLRGFWSDGKEAET